MGPPPARPTGFTTLMVVESSASPGPQPKSGSRRRFLGALTFRLGERQAPRLRPIQPRGLEENQRGEPAGLLTSQMDDSSAIRCRRPDLQLDGRARRIARHEISSVRSSMTLMRWPSLVTWRDRH